LNGEGAIGNIVLALIIALFIVGNFMLRKRSMEKTQLGKVVAILAEVNQNLKMADVFSFNLQIKKFKTASWKRNRNKLDFLDSRLQTTLANSFGLAEEFNQQIDLAQKHKSTSYLASIQADKLRNAFTKSQQELGEWFALNKDKKELFPKKRGLFG